MTGNRLWSARDAPAGVRKRPEGATNSSATHSVVATAGSETRALADPRFKHDFSGVRSHTDLAKCASSGVLQRQAAEGAAGGQAPAVSGGFAIPWQAARAALEIVNPISILSKDPNNILDSGTEHGGLIFKLGGRYFFTPAVVGASGSVDTWLALSTVPAEARRSIVGDYHTHGAPPDPRRDPRERVKESGEDFSGFHAELHPLTGEVTTGEQEKHGDIWEGRSDLETHRNEILDPKTFTLFLGTPTGRFALFTPATGVVFSFSPDPRLLPAGQRVPARASSR
jgi:hypothetical protein